MKPYYQEPLEEFHYPFFLSIARGLEKLLSTDFYTDSLISHYWKYLFQIRKRIKSFIGLNFSSPKSPGFFPIIYAKKDMRVLEERFEKISEHIMTQSTEFKTWISEYFSETIDDLLMLEATKKSLIKDLSVHLKDIKSIPTLYRKTSRPVHLI